MLDFAFNASLISNFINSVIVHILLIIFRFRANSTMAISLGIIERFLERGLHNVGRHQRRIQAHRSRRGGQTMGREEIQAQHELRQIIKGIAVRKLSYCMVSFSTIDSK